MLHLKRNSDTHMQRKRRNQLKYCILAAYTLLEVGEGVISVVFPPDRQSPVADKNFPLLEILLPVGVSLPYSVLNCEDTRH